MDDLPSAGLRGVVGVALGEDVPVHLQGLGGTGGGHLKLLLPPQVAANPRCCLGQERQALGSTG